MFLLHYIANSYDYVELREGGDDESPLIGRYCGTTIPPEYISNGNQVFVKFKTDYSIGHTGFRLRYELCKFSQAVFKCFS